MDLQTYKRSVKHLEERLEQDKLTLLKEYCISNNPYKIDDIISDVMGAIQIKKIQFVRGSFGDEPQCVYSGIELKKDKTPLKDKSQRGVYQNNIIKST